MGLNRKIVTFMQRNNLNKSLDRYTKIKRKIYKSKIEVSDQYLRTEIGSRGIPKQYRHLRNDPCSLCGSNENVQIDHKVPLALNGLNAPPNLQSMCNKCHKKKNKFDYFVIHLFKYIIYLYLKRLERKQNRIMKKRLDRK